MENSKLNLNIKTTSTIRRTEIKMSLAAIVMSFAFSLSLPGRVFAAPVEENVIEFSYANRPYATTGYSAPHFKGGAMLLTTDLTRRFNGCRIVEVQIANGRFPSQDEAPIEIFFTHDLNKTPFHTFEGEMDLEKPLEYKSYPLVHPVSIVEGEEMYVGFVGWSAGAKAGEMNYPVYTDYFVHTNIPGGFIGFSETTGAPEQMSWTDEGYSDGQVCIKLKIAGTNMPVDIAELNSVLMTSYAEPTQTIMAQLEIYNRGVNDMENLEVSYTIGDALTTTHIKTPPIKYNGVLYTNIKISVPEEGLNIPVHFSVDKVNGKEINPLDKVEKTCYVHSLASGKGFPHNLVVEEAGGTDCGWCVRGIVGLDNTFESHPDGSFIPISEHGRGTAVGYDAMRDRYITAKPSCLINRNTAIYGITDPNRDNLERIYQEVTSTPAIAKVEVSDYRFGNNELEVTSDIEFALEDNGTQYALAYVVTEDCVGPCMQSNAYSGMDVDMDGWENLPKYVETYLDFIARGISDFDGTIDGIPSNIEPGVRYRHSGVVSLERVRDFNRLNVVAMLINRTTGVIENGTRQKLSYEAGIEEVVSDFVEEEYFDLQGRRIIRPTRPGIYLRHRAGLTDKFIVR